MRKPTRDEIAAAHGKTIPDLIAPGLTVLFCGINPSLYSAAVGHHFARPGNRFWPTLHAGGFTDRIFRPDEGETLLALGYGITNLAGRATGAADELAPEELVAGVERLTAKVLEHRPAVVAFVGITAYRTGFGRKRAAPGRQGETLAGAGIWVLPSPSGRCVSFTVEPYRDLYRAVVGVNASRPA